MAIRMIRRSEWILFEYSGTVTPSQLAQSIQHVSESTRHASTPIRRLHDVRRVQRFNIFFRQLSALVSSAASTRESFPGGRAAFLIDQTYQRGIVNQYKILTERFGLEVQAFFNPDEARAWLLEMPVQPAATVDKL